MALTLVEHSETARRAFSDEQLDQLREIASKPIEVRGPLIPLETALFELSGEKSRWEALQALKKTLERLGYDVDVDARVLADEEAWKKETEHFDLQAASFGRLKAEVVEPLGLRLSVSGNKARIRRKSE